MQKEPVLVNVSLDDHAVKVLRELEVRVDRHNQKVAKALNDKSATLPFVIAALDEAESIFSKAKAQLKRIHLKKAK